MTQPTDPQPTASDNGDAPDHVPDAVTANDAADVSTSADTPASSASSDAGSSSEPRPSPSPRPRPTPAARPASSSDAERSVPDSVAEQSVAESVAEPLVEPHTVAEPAARAERGEVGGYAGNGRSEPAPVSLPPPWQRAAAAGSAPLAAAAAGSAVPGPVATAPGRRSGSTARTDLASARTVSIAAPPAAPESDPMTEGRDDYDEREDGPGDGPDGGRGDGRAARRPGSGSAQDSPPGGFPMGWPRNRRPRQASLQLKRLDPWSVLKIALVFAVVVYLVWMVAVGVLYGALNGIGVWERLNGQYADLVAQQAGGQLISAGRVFGVAAVVGAVNSLLFAVALSVGAFVYNVSADMVGGIEVTLSERD